MESYSVEAILSAVDSGFTKTMNDAQKSMSGMDDSAQKTGTSIMDIAKGVGVFKLVDAGIGLVRDSLDGAISRFDTLNKYPTVMTALGYSADQVESSMNKLSDGIDGLPTSLDEIVANTQQLAISTGDLDKGTDTAIALNNAFLASGASTADASRGMQQYVQMLSKGTVDMQSWRSIQETMPIAMDKVAKSFEDRGVKSVNELYDALQGGQITFDEFNNRLIELNDGVGGFAELAQKNSAGIETSFQNIKTAVVKGLTDTIDAIDKGLEDAGLGGIAGVLDRVKEAVNGTFEAFNTSLPSIIDKVSSAIKFFADNSEWIIPILKGLAVAIGSLMVIHTVISAVTSVTTAISFLISPIGLVLLAIAALVAAGILLYENWDTIKEGAAIAWQTIKDTIGGVVDWITDKWQKFTDWIGNITDRIGEFFSNLWEGITDTVSNAVESVQNDWNGVKEFFSGLWDGIKQGAADAWDNLVTGISNVINSVFEWFDKLKNINLLDIGKAIIDGFVDGLKNAWESGKNFIGGIGDWIRENKGPIQYDRKLLIPAGNAIMEGLNNGLINGFGTVQSTVGGIGDRISDAMNTDYSMDIGANVARANRSINSEVTHQVNYGGNSNPTVLNVHLGSQTLEILAGDISELQGKQSDIYAEF